MLSRQAKPPAATSRRIAKTEPPDTSQDALAPAGMGHGCAGMCTGVHWVGQQARVCGQRQPVREMRRPASIKHQEVSERSGPSSLLLLHRQQQLPSAVERVAIVTAGTMDMVVASRCTQVQDRATTSLDPAVPVSGWLQWQLLPSCTRRCGAFETRVRLANAPSKHLPPSISLVESGFILLAEQHRLSPLLTLDAPNAHPERNAKGKVQVEPQACLLAPKLRSQLIKATAPAGGPCDPSSAPLPSAFSDSRLSADCFCLSPILFL